LARLVEDMLLLARLDEHSPDSGLSIHRAPTDLRTLADEERLRQVVTNLVGNATTHTPAGTPVRIGVATADGHAVLEVADQGEGLTAQQAARVFERFYRAGSSRTRSAGAGAGLGLSIVKSLVDAHDGQVQLTTAPGKGATFRILLPRLPDGFPSSGA
jgi:two-component system OmpR family sensor kinase